MLSRQVHILDNVLPDEVIESIRDQHFCLSEAEGRNRWVDRGNEPCYFQALIEVASQYFDLKEAVGYEWWTHKNTYTGKGWHIDYHEAAWQRDRTLKTPMCSIIFYPLVANIKGGEFVLEDLKIPAKTNRMILVSSNEPHNIANYNVEDADRWSLLINPWNYVPDGLVPSWHLSN